MTLVNVLMMRELQMFTLLLHFMMMASFLVSSSPKERIASCLSQHNVNNFTTFTEVSTNSFYYRLLNFSIQNLRFAEVSFPKPLAIVIPENVEQLVRTVGCCRDELLEIRVRCGGHSYEGTSYISTNGAPFVIIDMMKLNKVSVDVKAETALVEGGATLGEAYYAIAEASNIHGFSAGSCPTVGAGGHIGGGGFGLLSRKYGLAADNVVDAQLVDADGRLLNRDAMGEDVFWAIRGGGGGVWGIVYAWKIKLVTVPETVTSCVISRPGSKAHVSELVNKWQHVAPEMNGDFYLSCFMGAGLPEATTTGLSTTFKGFYLGPRTEAISILNQTFPELQITRQECKEMSWIESIVFFSELAAVSSAADLKNRYLQEKNYFKGKADYVRKLISLPGIKAALDKLEKEPKGRVLLDPYGGVMNNISSQYIPFPHRKGNLYAIQYLVEWKEKDNERSQEYVNWIREFYETMTPYVSDTPRAAYINYMDFDIGVNNLMGLVMETGNDSPSGDAVEIGRVWGEKYFLKNYDRLVKAKTLIDPLNVFKHPQSIPPMSHSLLSYSAF